MHIRTILRFTIHLSILYGCCPRNLKSKRIEEKEMFEMKQKIPTTRENIKLSINHMTQLIKQYKKNKIR